jgi:hypothetical protein
MDTDRVAAIEALLGQAEAAHGIYERNELGGAYDEDWPRWYAEHAVAHGLGDLLGHPVTADEVAAFLTLGWTEFQAADPPPTEPWAAVTARRIASEL